MLLSQNSLQLARRVFGCKLSCTAAFVERTPRASGDAGPGNQRRPRNPRPETKGKNLGADGPGPPQLGAALRPNLSASRARALGGGSRKPAVPAGEKKCPRCVGELTFPSAGLSFLFSRAIAFVEPNRNRNYSWRGGRNPRGSSPELQTLGKIDPQASAPELPASGVRERPKLRSPARFWRTPASAAA